MNAVWGLTWRELIRKRVTLMAAVMSVVFLIAYWFVANAIASQQRILGGDSAIALFNTFISSAMVLTLGFFFGAFAIAFVAIFTSVAAVMGEAEQGVLQSVLARPIPRWKWFLGRWFGFVSYGVMYALGLYTFIILICWMETGILYAPLVLLKAFLLFASVVPLLVSLTMFGSCFLTPLGNGIGMTMLFGMGWLGSTIGRFMGLGKIQLEGLQTLETITGLIKLIMPADALQQRMLSELFSISELSGLLNLNRDLSVFSISEVPSNTFLIYCMLYTAILFTAGLIVMMRKDY